MALIGQDLWDVFKGFIDDISPQLRDAIFNDLDVVVALNKFLEQWGGYAVYVLEKPLYAAVPSGGIGKMVIHKISKQRIKLSSNAITRWNMQTNGYWPDCGVNGFFEYFNCHRHMEEDYETFLKLNPNAIFCERCFPEKVK